MARRTSGLKALEKAFRKSKAITPRHLVRYSDELKRIAVEAVRDGVSVGEVSLVTGVTGQSLATWQRQFKKSPRKARGKRRIFRRLKVVGDQGRCASIFVGQDIRLDIPTELLSAELIRRLAGAAS